jgi:Ser/Thr protein kinase RdoA (MazF antagonist)
MMNRWMIRLWIVCLPALLLAACQSKAKAFLPVTGLEKSALPALVAMTRENVLQYVVSSARLESIPATPDWQLDRERSSEEEYCFRSGEWTMLIRPAETQQRVLILNRAEGASWIGYVTADGDVVDTTYAP